MTEATETGPLTTSPTAGAATRTAVATARKPPAEFSEAYAKAHRAYGAVAGLLLAWELVGIQLTTEPLTDLKITLKSPEAMPFVLAALVVYFGFRLSVEWFQADDGRRRRRASIVDFTVAHTLGTGALVLLAAQRIRGQQVFEQFRQMTGAGILLFFVVVAGTFFLTGPIYAYLRNPRQLPGRTSLISLLVGVIIAVFGIPAARAMGATWFLGGVGLVVGIVYTAIIVWSVERDRLRAQRDGNPKR